MDDLPVEQNYFVGLTIGCARYQLERMSERLGRTRICDGFMTDPTAPFDPDRLHVGTQQSV